VLFSHGLKKAFLFLIRIEWRQEIVIA